MVLTSSREERDLVESYRLGVNAYVVKPVDFQEFARAVKELGVFWAIINEPPPGTSNKDKPRDEKKLAILHLEDSLLDSELVEARLEEDGIPCEITRVLTKEDFIRALETGRFDLILADYSLPGFDGLTALELGLQKQPQRALYFCVRSDRRGFSDRDGQKGATDYVLKDRLDRLGPAVKRALLEATERAERRTAQEKLRKAYAELEQRVEQGPRN